jgi:phosphotransferase system enzyme I (PtsI)
MNERKADFQGTPIEGGYVLAPAFLYRPFVSSLPSAGIEASQVSSERASYERARDKAESEYRSLIASCAPSSPKKAILEAQEQILLDEDVKDEVEAAIQGLSNAPKALREVYGSYIALFQAKKDPLFQARYLDLADLENRLLRCLEGKEAPSLSSFEGEVILVAEDLAPSEMASLDREHVKGLVLEKGGETSHTAVLARSYGLACLLGAKGVMSALKPGQTVALDSVKGALYLSPDQALAESWAEREKEYLFEKKEQEHYLPLPGKTKDGTRIQINLNLGDVSPESLAKAPYVDGVGLLRSEFLYMQSDHLPSEEEQFEAYKKVLLSFGDKPVIVRTLDIGGDKKLPYFSLPKEENPQLGERALRLSLAHPELFKPQLRALLRASVYGQLGIMFPMVETTEDFLKAKAVVANCEKELRGEGVNVGSYRLGVMIEIPALALAADSIARLADFASIGSNDLTQYTLAVDRGNPALSDYYQKYHPSVLRLIALAVEAFDKAGKPIAVCGELGGDSLGAPLLVGMGLRSLSMSFAKVAGAKAHLAKRSLATLQKEAKACLSCDNEQAVKALLFGEKIR